MRRPGRSVLNDLARGAGNAAIGSGQGLRLGVVNSQSMPRHRRFAVPVEHRNAQQVYLKEDQQARSKCVPGWVKLVTSHGLLLYWKFGKEDMQSLLSVATNHC
jgi:hypothetical protein